MGNSESTARDQDAINNRANQLNPNNEVYKSSGGDESYFKQPKGDDNNRANQLNPNNESYHKARGK
jgi:hypothetical protein